VNNKFSCGLKSRLNKYMKKKNIGDCSIMEILSDSGNSGTEFLICLTSFYASIYSQEILHQDK